MGNDQSSKISDIKLSESQETKEAMQQAQQLKVDQIKIVAMKSKKETVNNVYQQQIELFDKVFGSAINGNQSKAINYEQAKSGDSDELMMPLLQGHDQVANYDDKSDVQVFMQLMRNNMQLLQNTQKQLEDVQMQINRTEQKKHAVDKYQANILANQSVKPSEMQNLLLKKLNK